MHWKSERVQFYSAGPRSGAKRMLISSGSEHADVTVALGANDHVLQDQRIISNGTCTTNTLALLLRVLNDAFGFLAGYMTTTQCYTGGQLSMVPTTMSAASLIYIILPKLAMRVKGCAVRVPTFNFSAADLMRQLASKADVSAHTMT